MQLSDMCVLLQGAGKMGQAMLKGWLQGGLKPENTIIFDPHPSPEVANLVNDGLRINTTGSSKPDFVIIATKPQVMAEAWAGLAPFVPESAAIVSIAAGKPVSFLAKLAGENRAIVRAMPNTPAAIGKGITGAYANPFVREEVRLGADLLLKAVGDVVWLKDESLIDAVTAVSGSGPAYVFHLVEAMAAAGVKAGLPQELSMQLARQTVIGAGALLEASDEDAGQLRANVTSPGGTTQAALDVLRENEALTDLMTRAILNAAKRAKELAG